MTRKLLFAAFLVTLALTVIAAHHQLTNAAPNMAPPPKNAPPLEIYAERFQMSASQVASAAQLQASAAYTTPMVGGWYKVTGGNGLQQTIRAIDMISPTEGWAVGDYGLLLHYTNGAWATNTISNPQPYYNFGNLDMLKSVSMVNAGDGWAVGDPCYTWSSFGSCVIDANNVVLRYDGQRWTRFLTVTTNVPSGTGLELMVVQMLSSTEGWAVGNDILHFDGTSWNSVTNTPNIRMSAISMLNSSEGWAVGYSTVPSGGWTWPARILHYTGGQWVDVATPSVPWLRSVAMVNDHDGWAVGDSGTILRYNGSVWTQVASPVGSSLHTVRMVNANEGWAVGPGVILHYDGNAWTAVSNPGGNYGLYALDLIGNEAWAGGEYGMLLHLTGSAWSLIQGPNSQPFGVMGAVSPYEIWVDRGSGNGFWHVVNGSQYIVPRPDGYLRAIDMLSPTDGWAVGQAWTGGWTGIMHYTNGAWVSVFNPITQSLNAIDMLSSTDGWAIGENGTILHYNGSEWITVTSPVTDNLSLLQMISPTEGWALSGAKWNEPTVILHYTGGQWITQTNPALYRLSAISMLDGNEGWAVGYRDILHYHNGVWTRDTSLCTGMSPNTCGLYGVATVSADEAWAVGGYSGYDGTTGSLRKYGYQLIHYKNGIWTKYPAPSLNGTWPNLSWIRMVNANEGWAGGSDWASPGHTVLHYVDGLWYVVNDPVTMAGMGLPTDPVWQATKAGELFQFQQGLWHFVAHPNVGAVSDISMVSANEGWATVAPWGIPSGAPAKTMLHYSQGTWTTATVPITSVAAVHMISLTAGFAVGTDDPPCYSFGCYSPSRMMQYNGSTWNEVSVPDIGPLMSVWTKGTETGWAMTNRYDASSGWPGVPVTRVLRYAGGNWQVAPAPPTSGPITTLSADDAWSVGQGIAHWNGTDWITVTSPVTYQLNAVTVISSTEGWAVGDGGSIIRWDGAAWMTMPSPVTHSIYAVSMISPTEGWAIGNWSVRIQSRTYYTSFVLHYADGQWVEMPGKYPVRFSSITQVSPTEWWSRGSYRDPDTNIYWPGLLRYVDGRFYYYLIKERPGGFSELAVVGPGNIWGTGNWGTSLYSGTTRIYFRIGHIVHFLLPQANVTLGQGASVVYTDTRGLTTTVGIPTGAVTNAVTIVYSPVDTVTVPGGFSFAGHACALNAYSGATLLPGFTFQQPVTITIHYSDADVAGLDENSLVLRYWTGSTWASDGITLIERNPAQNHVVFTVTHLSDFALFGVPVPEHKVYLPIVIR